MVSPTINDNANLIEKVLNLQKEVQELRGQLEIQAHDLKLLQQQQLAFYKDLDSRLSGGAAKSAQTKPMTDINLGTNKPVSKIAATVPTKTAPLPVPVPTGAKSSTY